MGLVVMIVEGITGAVVSRAEKSQQSRSLYRYKAHWLQERQDW